MEIEIRESELPRHIGALFRAVPELRRGAFEGRERLSPRDQRPRRRDRGIHAGLSGVPDALL